MNGSVTLGKIRGIKVSINYTWLIAFVLITWSLAVGFFPAQFPGWEPQTYWIVGAIASLLLFASVLVHELAHSFVAQRLGMHVQSINLFIFGGVSNIAGEAKRARDEFYISAVGPLTSVALGLVFGAAFWLLRSGNPQLTALLLYLGAVNLLLAAFNLIPGFPLDGGRVFRAIVWGVTQSFRRATRIATTVGKGIAYLFMFGGLYLAVSGEFLSGIWLVFIGWFLSEAAEASYRQMAVQESFRGVHVSDLMTQSPATVGTHASLRDVVDDFILLRNVRTVPVVESDRLVGLITLNEIRAIPAERWPEVLVADAMIPLAGLHTATPDEDAAEALRALSEEDVNQLPVVENDRLVGLLSRANMLRFLQVREALGVRARP